jgi:hypothetical protein
MNFRNDAISLLIVGGSGMMVLGFFDLFKWSNYLFFAGLVLALIGAFLVRNRSDSQHLTLKK